MKAKTTLDPKLIKSLTSKVTKAVTLTSKNVPVILLTELAALQGRDVQDLTKKMRKQPLYESKAFLDANVYDATYTTPKGKTAKTQALNLTAIMAFGVVTLKTNINIEMLSIISARLQASTNTGLEVESLRKQMLEKESENEYLSSELLLLSDPLITTHGEKNLELRKQAVQVLRKQQEESEVLYDLLKKESKAVQSDKVKLDTERLRNTKLKSQLDSSVVVIGELRTQVEQLDSQISRKDASEKAARQERTVANRELRSIKNKIDPLAKLKSKGKVVWENANNDAQKAFSRFDYSVQRDVVDYMNKGMALKVLVKRVKKTGGV